MTDVPSDFDLLDAWGKGDLTAGRALYERYFGMLFRFLRTKVEEGRDEARAACQAPHDLVAIDARASVWKAGFNRFRSDRDAQDLGDR